MLAFRNLFVLLLVLLTSCSGPSASRGRTGDDGQEAQIPPRGLVAIVNSSTPLDSVGMVRTCAGVLISESVVLTASHCISLGRQAGSISVVWGTNNICRRVQRSHVLPAISYRRHPKVDLAVIHLATKVAMSSALPRILPNAETAALSLWGWGKLTTPGANMCTLSRASLERADAAQCRSDILETSSDKLYYCLQSSGASGRIPCIGDSGSPLYQQSGDHSARLVGIASWTVGCRVDSRSRYVRLWSVRDWIVRQLHQ